MLDKMDSIEIIGLYLLYACLPPIVVGVVIYLIYAVVNTRHKLDNIERNVEEIKELIKKQERTKFKLTDTSVNHLANSGNDEETKGVSKLWNGFPLHLYVQGSETLVGVLNEDEVLALEEHIEIENYESPRFAVTSALIDYLKERKSNPKLLEILAKALGEQEEVSVYLL